MLGVFSTDAHDGHAFHAIEHLLTSLYTTPKAPVQSLQKCWGIKYWDWIWDT